MYIPIQHPHQSITDECTGRWVIVDGDLVDFDHARVSAFDRSFLYGDGVYTTLKVKAGKPVFLARHLARLRRHMDRLMFGGTGFDFDLPEAIRKLIVSNTIVDGCVRVTVSRGTQAPFSLAKTNSLLVVGFARSLSTTTKKAFSVITVPETRDQFRDVKAVNRLPCIFALRQALMANADEAVFVADGTMIEATCCNIFESRGSHVVTPHLENRGLAGIIRDVLLEKAPCQISPIGTTSSGPLFLTNSLIGIAPIVRINGISIKEDTDLLQVLQQLLDRAENEENS